MKPIVFFICIYVWLLQLPVKVCIAFDICAARTMQYDYVYIVVSKILFEFHKKTSKKGFLSKNIELKSSNPTQVLRWIKPTLNKKVSRIKEQQNSNRFQNYSIFVVVFKGSCIVNRSQFIRLANGLKLLLSESVYKIMIKCYLYLYKISFSIWLIYMNPK